MRTHFSEYLRPKEGEMQTLWAEAVFIFDTNVLLNLYRMSRETSSAIMHILQKLEGRLYLPHQVTVEFFKHREEVIAEQVNAFEKMRTLLKGIPGQFRQQFSRHACIPIAEITEALEKCVGEQVATVYTYQNTYPSEPLFRNDAILLGLDTLFANCNEGPYTIEQDAALNKKVDERIQHNLPPCFVPPSGKSSAAPASNPHQGDGRVWFQIVNYAEANKKPIIFVTGDEKPNWWRTVKIGSKERVTGPHFHLVQDVEAVSNNRFMMYTQAAFLSDASTYLNVPEQNTQAMDEVRQVQEHASMEEPMKGPIESELLDKTEFAMKSKSMENDVEWLNEPKRSPLKESKSQEKAEDDGGDD